MMANRICRGMIAAVVFLSSAALAEAGERHDRGGSHFERHRVERVHADRHDRNRDYSSNFSGHSDLPSSIRGIGTYAGGISALRVRGNGIYFHVDAGRREVSPVILAPKAKIIEVNQTVDNSAFAPRFGCLTEMGVCVIRGDR